MITKTFICDKCNKSVGENELIPVKVEIVLPPKKGSSYSRTATAKKELCKDCLVKEGIIYEIPEDEKQAVETQVKNVKTLETKLIEILEDLGVCFGCEK